MELFNYDFVVVADLLELDLVRNVVVVPNLTLIRRKLFLIQKSGILSQYLGESHEILKPKPSLRKIDLELSGERQLFLYLFPSLGSRFLNLALALRGHGATVFHRGIH